MLYENLKKFIREVPFKGVNFYDIMPLLADPDAFGMAIFELYRACNLEKKKSEIDLIISPESRGFILGSAVAHIQGSGFTVARKKGALPVVAASHAYQLEYGAAVLEIPDMEWGRFNNIVYVDDVLASGGTSVAVARLLEKMGKNITKYVYLIELTGLNGRARLDAPVESLFRF